MKNKFSLITLIIIFTVFFASCAEVSNNSLPANTTLQNVESTDEIMSTTSYTDSNIDESSKVESTVSNESSQVESTVSNESSNVQSTISTTEPTLTNLTVGPYTVYDAYNSRGLSTKKLGYGFGIAKDGKPHSVSIDNQIRFDGMDGINALAIDTKSNDKRMYLTFDCGYEYKNLTADILDTLKEKQVKAAFFITGDYAKKNHPLVKRMIYEGHIVGNHSWGHKSFPTISREKMAKEIWDLEDYLKINFNYSSPYFRFPSGENSHCSLELVSSMGYRSIFWSVAYADWDTSKQPTKANAVSTVTSRYHSGAVILLHAVSQANADGLAEMIDIAHEQGYTFKTLDDYYN